MENKKETGTLYVRGVRLSTIAFLNKLKKKEKVKMHIVLEFIVKVFKKAKL